MARLVALILALTGLLAAGLFLPRLRRPWLARSGLLLLSTGACLMGLELALATGVLQPAAFGVVGGVRAQPVHMLPHRAESLDGLSVGEDLVPGPDRPMAKPPGTTRLLFLGDSFTRGDGVRDAETFAHVATRLVDATRPAPVHGLNHGISGLQFAHADRLLSEYGLGFEPDVVVWVFVLNDLEARTGLDNDYINHRFLRDRLDRRGISLTWDLIRLAGHQRQAGAQTEAGYRASLSWERNPTGMAGLRDGLRRHVEATAARGARLLFVVFPLLVRLDAYPFVAEHAAVLAAAHEAGAETLDLLPVFQGRDPERLWVSDSDFHPNAEGHRLAGVALAAAITGRPIPDSRARHCPPLAPPAVAEVEAARDAVCVAPTDGGALARLGRLTMESAEDGYEFTTPVYAVAADRLARQAGDSVGSERARSVVADLRSQLASDPRFRGRH